MAPELREWQRNSLQPVAHQQIHLTAMLEIIAIILVLIWLLGMISSYTLGGYIHLLLVAALVTVIIRVVRGHDTLK